MGSIRLGYFFQSEILKCNTWMFSARNSQRRLRRAHVEDGQGRAVGQPGGAEVLPVGSESGDDALHRRQLPEAEAHLGSGPPNAQPSVYSHSAG